jgi:hypothetical protein
MGASMIEIPEDIMQSAREAWFKAEGKIIMSDSEQVIALAILAERERCALRLETISHSGMNESWWRRKFQVAADVVRSGK